MKTPQVEALREAGMTPLGLKPDAAAKKEYDFIVSVDPRNPGAAFNHDTACFLRYCRMQADDMARHGHGNMAADVDQFILAVEKGAL